MVWMGFFVGSLGGLVAGINVIFGHFKALPTKPLSVSKEAIRNRALFVFFRVLVAGVIGGVTTFWFGRDVIAGVLTLDKLVFIQFVAGLAGTALTKPPGTN